MLSLVDKNQFKAGTLSKQLKLMKKRNPPPQLHQNKIFEGAKAPSKKRKKKSKGKKY